MDKKINSWELAVEFLDAAKKEYSDPSYVSSLALIGIGNALLSSVRWALIIQAKN